MRILARAAALAVLLCQAASGELPRETRRGTPMRAPRGFVRVSGHSLADDRGPFLGLGVSYFTALWRHKFDRPRLESDFAYLSRQGFNYYRMLSMVGWNGAWDGREIAPVSFTSRAGKRVDAWPDYRAQLQGLIDLAYDRYGLRTEITIFADAQIMPDKRARIAHMDRILREVLPGRERKVILIEVANEAWQNGFPGEQGVKDLREFGRHLSDRTRIPVAISSNHAGSFEEQYRRSGVDLATWHFSRDRGPDDGWKPVYDCWDIAKLDGYPPVVSNEPIGPGSSVNAERDPIKLVMAAAYAYAARLPAYVFHSAAGGLGKTRFEDMAGIDRFRPILGLLPADLPSWQAVDAKELGSLFTVFAADEPGCYWPDIGSSPDGCVRMVVSRKGDRFAAVAIGVRQGGLKIEARLPVRFKVYDPLTGKQIAERNCLKGDKTVLPEGPGGIVLIGTVNHGLSHDGSTTR